MTNLLPENADLTKFRLETHQVWYCGHKDDILGICKYNHFQIRTDKNEDENEDENWLPYDIEKKEITLEIEEAHKGMKALYIEEDLVLAWYYYIKKI